MWLYARKSKDKCFEKYKELKALVEMQSENKIKTFQSNNGGEFVPKAFKCFLEWSWHQATNMYHVYASTKWSGRACKLHYHGDGKKDASWSKPRQIILGEAVPNAMYTWNWYPTKTLESITSKEAWRKSRPCIVHMCMFRCFTYSMLSDEKEDNIDTKGTTSLFLNYFEVTKAYRLLYCKLKRS